MLTSARNVADLVRASAQRGPSHVALVDVASGSSLTWETIDGAVDAFARRLADSGLEPGDRVAVRLPTSPEFVVAVFGILLGWGYVRASGPFASLGMDQATAVQPERFGRVTGSPPDNQIFVIFSWSEPGLCPRDFSVKASETASQVRVGEIFPHRFQGTGSCPAWVTSGNGVAYAELSVAVALPVAGSDHLQPSRLDQRGRRA